MSGKFMKIKKIIIPTLTMVIIASQLFGCSCSTQDELNKMINNSEEIVIEVAEPDFEEQGTESKLVWTPLAELTNYGSFREGFDNVLGIEKSAYTKTGILYIDSEGNANGNNTLYNVFTNKNFVENYWNNEETQDAISSLAVELYADVDENSTDTLYASINAYFNLLADNEVNYYNGQASLTRGEAMTMLMRAVTPVEDLKSNSEFTEAVGKSEYTDYASYVSDDSYLTTADKSLNNQTFNGTITRGEFIYMVVNNIFGADIISNTDISNVSLKDCKATTKTYDYKEKSYVKSYDLSYAIQSPDDGAPADLYKALAVANKIEVIGSETRWDEALTKSEAVEIIIDAILAHNNLNGYEIEVSEGETIDYTAEAKESYERNKNSVSCDEATFITEYNSLKQQGLDELGILEKLVTTYPKEVESELPPEQRPTIGNYKEEYKGDFFYQRTYDNGAIRYYYFSSETRLFYEIDEIGTIPEAVQAQIQKDIQSLIPEEPTTAPIGVGGTSGGGTSSGGSSSSNSSNDNNSSSQTETETTTEPEIDDPFGNVDNREEGWVPPEDWEGLEGGVVGDDGEIIGD